MATEWISPTWRMPEEQNQSKFENYSLDFDGTQDIDCGNNSVFNNTFTGNAFSFSVWVKSSSNVAYDGILNFSSRVQSFLNSNKIKIWLQGSSGYIVTAFTSNTTILSDTWYHIVFTKNGNDNTLYINGVSDNTVTSTGNVASTTGNFRIGSYNGSQYFWDGNLTEVSIFDYSLTDGTGGTQDQITALYNLGTPVNPMVLTPLPVAYYPLGSGSTGDAADPATTLTIPNSSVPSATVFDFDNLGGTSNDFIDINSLNSNILNSSFTISLWLKKEPKPSYTDNDRILDLTVDANTSLQIICDNSSGKFAINFILSGVSKINQQGFNSWTSTSNKWNQIVFTWDGSSYVYYFNGQSVSSTGTVSVGVAGTGFFLGKRADGNLTTFYNGQMSNVSVFNTALPATGTESVESLYNYGTPPNISSYSGLKAWWKMNVDTSTWNGSDWVIGNSTANYTTALNFPGGTDYIDFGTGFPTTLGASATAATASGWVKINDLTQKQALFNITTAGGNYFGSFAIWHDPASNKLYAYINGNANNIYLSSGITDNNWHHLAVVYDQSAGATITDGLKLYLDGSPVTPTASAGSTPAFVDFTASLITRLGWGWNNTFTAVADMSNWAMWNSALTAGNISTLYNGGTPETIISLSPTSYYKLDNITTGIQDAGSSSNNGTITGSITEVDSFVSTLNGISSGMTTANLVTSDLSRSIPYSSYSMVFDGVSDYITLSNPTIFTDFSLSFWYKSDSAVSGYDTVVGRDTIDGGILTSIVFTGPLSFKNRPGSWTALTTTSPSSTEFKHFSVTYDSTANELKGYCNGVLEVTTTPVFSSATGNEQSFDRIGRYYGSNYLDGQLSNLATFSSILSQDQILTIYNGGVPNDISSLSPVNWWSLSGDSYFDGSNFICPDLGSGNNNGTSSGMGGTELVGDGPGSTANGIATSMDIPGNLQGNAPNSSKNAFSVNMNSADRVEDVPA